MPLSWTENNQSVTSRRAATWIRGKVPRLSAIVGGWYLKSAGLGPSNNVTIRYRPELDVKLRNVPSGLDILAVDPNSGIRIDVTLGAIRSDHIDGSRGTRNRRLNVRTLTIGTLTISSPCELLETRLRGMWPGETDMSFGLYLTGFSVLIVGLTIGANMLHVPASWTGVGIVVMVGLGILSGVSMTRRRDPSD